MFKFLLSYIEPEHYSPSVVEEAAAGDIPTMTDPLRLIRLGLALRAPKLDEARQLVTLLNQAALVGYPLFQLRCGALVLALLEKDDGQVRRALDLWLDDWRLYPANWADSVLREPALAPYLKNIAPERLIEPKPHTTALTSEDRAFVKDIKSAITKAVIEQFEWLKDVDPKSSPTVIAKRYGIVGVDRNLRECTIGAKANEWPDIIIALDDDGNFTGSFLAH